MIDRPMDRRRFLGVTSGALLALSLAPAPALAAGGAPAKGSNGRLVPDGKTGTILYTQRDAIGRPGVSTGLAPKGYVGGSEWMSTPEDLGPLVDLPGGFLEVFTFLASVGYKQVEFAGYGQNAANPGGTAPSLGNLGNQALLAQNRDAWLDYIRTLRSFLDAAGLEAIGSHGYVPSTWDGPGSPAIAGTTAGTMHPWERQRFLLELEAANILGMPYTGTGSDPTSPNNRNVEAWTLAAEKWMALNALAAPTGVQLYPHNHAEAYQFLADGPTIEVRQDLVTGAPLAAPQQVRTSSGTRLMEHYLRSTDRSCPIELDVYWAHVAQHRFSWYWGQDGQRHQQLFDPTAFAAANSHRIPLFHAKDGDRNAQPAGTGNGYDMVPFRDVRSDIDYDRFLAAQGAKGFHNPNYEQDNAPGGTADPGRSLRYSRFSAQRMRALRG